MKYKGLFKKTKGFLSGSTLLKPKNFFKRMKKEGKIGNVYYFRDTGYVPYKVERKAYLESERMREGWLRWR